MKLGSLTCRIITGLLLAGAVAGIATATPIVVPDFSFENTPIVPGGQTGGPDVGTNWVGAGNGPGLTDLDSDGVCLHNITNALFTPDVNGDLPAPADGTNYLIENINGHAAYAWQVIGTVQSNTIYTLTVAVGQSLFAESGQGEIALINGVYPFVPVLGSTPVDSSTLAPGTWADYTLVYTNGYQASGPLAILLEAYVGGEQLLFDNVRLDATTLPASALALTPTLSTTNVIYQGTEITLSENPAGLPPFHYQWLADNGSGGTSFTSIPGATNATVAVDTTPLSPYAPYEYVVVVSNASGISTSAPVTITPVVGPPVLLADTLPSYYSSDTEGGNVTFTASFDGSRPLYYQWMVDYGGGPQPIQDATNTTYTIANLDVSDTANYSLVASNSDGTAQSTEVDFTVYPAPTPDANGVLVATGNQDGLGGNTLFVPTYVIATNSLIAGALPTASAGDFTEEDSGGIVPLTDGIFGPLPPEGTPGQGLATAGPQAGAGTFVTYKLPPSPEGWDITNIVTYGGWSDNGRIEQEYEIFYSTVANPTNFQLIKLIEYLPIVSTGFQTATRVSVTSETGVLAKNVAAIEFFFNYQAPGPENGWEGYAELQAFGTNSAPLPVLVQNIQPGSGSDVEGDSLTLTANFSSPSPVAFQWYKDGAPIAGATNTSLVLTNLQLSDTSVSPGYVLQASNSSGVVSSSACPFTVNPAPSPDGSGLLVAQANQTGNGPIFTPTWTVAPGSLIAGHLASSAPDGNFASENSGGIPVLTDGQFGIVGSSIDSTLATCGANAGQYIIYALGGSTNGYDLYSIVTYGGWSDGGRDQQAYDVYYSTIENPTNFIYLDGVSFLPTLPGSVPSATRVVITPGSDAPIATNVAAVMFNFTTSPTGDGENGYEGYSELQIFGTPSASVAPYAPAVLTDTVPGRATDVAGSSVTFNASFVGTPPLTYQWQFNGTPIAGATGTSLTLTNLQTSQSGAYNLVAQNTYGSASSTPNTFTVSAAPTPVNGVVIAPASQLVVNSGFTPTWTIPAGSLISGTEPSSIGSGNWVNQFGAGGLPVLTDGTIGGLGLGGIGYLATAGTAPSGAGTFAIYTLPSTPGGYSLSKIITYGGWTDGGRDQQAYTVSYSKVSSPSTFIALASVSYLPANPAGTPSATRVTLTPSAAGPLATNVAAVKFDFTSPSGENGWEGYSELQVFGASAAPLSVTSSGISGGNFIFAGSGGTPGSSYTVLTSTNLALPLLDWTTAATGVFDGSGAFSNAIPVSATAPGSFFRLKVP